MWPFSKKPSSLDVRIKDAREWHDKKLSDDLSAHPYRDVSDEARRQYIEAMEESFQYWANAQRGIPQGPYR